MDQKDVGAVLEELAEDEAAAGARIAACEAAAAALARLGELMWVSGAIIGSDRVEGSSPFGFGDDRLVGLATVCQIGGELGTGAIALLKADNRYSASALVRQLVEVEYLAHAFEAQDEVAAQWLRADREARVKFWSPAKLRSRANGRFLSTDYWHHCEMGGHPASPGMRLLPGHDRMHVAYLWADLAGHLSSTWRLAKSAVAQARGEIPADAGLPDAERWQEVDGFYAALGDVSGALRDR